MIINKVYLANRGDCCGNRLTNVMVRTRDIQSDKSTVLKHAFLIIVLQRCISQYTRLLGIEEMHLTRYWTIVLEGCISQYIRLLYWRDPPHNTLDYCIG